MGDVKMIRFPEPDDVKNPDDLRRLASRARLVSASFANRQNMGETVLKYGSLLTAIIAISVGASAPRLPGALTFGQVLGALLCFGTPLVVQFMYIGLRATHHAARSTNWAVIAESYEKAVKDA
ncbi:MULTISPECIES: hypothetical protein [unclassified Micromonospora]|uniref:hypothetical protein n=1 Tax=unclassified Micromonospora TaxID=2617518 RepID=UPI001034369D|nr:MULTISPECIES: hypothetical protein [unclassified Micromonospora]QKW15112.1 hypothetical protein HUT12_21655 [Verrucosispora sp. NA02020]TBL45046.1 hypothetical protein EYA84_01120 [Verrucosispora sp. SN26_14.1]